MSTDTEDDPEVRMFLASMRPRKEAQQKALEERRRKEKRTQLTKRQRKRGAVRTHQMGFRCSPAFHDEVKAMAKRYDVSIADVLEEAFDLWKEAKGLDGGTS